MQQQGRHLTEESDSRKRKRLTYACNRCRRKKVRCDDQQPSCKNCSAAGSQCITQDPRQPDAFVQRQEAQRHSITLSTYENQASKFRISEASTSPSVYAGDSASLIGSQYSNAGDRVRVDTKFQNNEPLQTQNQQQAESQDEGPIVISNPPPENHLPALPRFAASNSVQLLTQWLDLAFARIGHPQRLTDIGLGAKSYMRLGDGFSNPGTQQISPAWILPQFHNRQTGVCRYLSLVNLVFPILGPTDQQTLLEDSTRLDIIAAGTQPELKLIFHCLLQVAANPCAHQGQQNLVSQTLRCVLDNLGAIIESDSIEAMTVLLLSAIIHRYRNEAGTAWHMLSLAVSMATTLGLDRLMSRQAFHSSTEVEKQKYRVWYSLYVLDRTLSIELERSALIRDYECIHDFPEALFWHGSEPSNTLYQEQERVFKAIISFARLQGEVNERLLISRYAQDRRDLTVEQIIIEKMRAIGELDQKLLAWSENLPSDLRPSDQTFCDPSIAPAVSFLAIQYYQTSFLLSRNALIVNNKSIQETVRLHFDDTPYRVRLANGQQICCAAARSIISVLNNFNDSNDSSVLLSTHAPLVAICALAIETLRMPQAEKARADVELQANAIRLIGRQQAASNGLKSPGLTASLESLHLAVLSRINLLRDPVIEDVTRVPETTTTKVDILSNSSMVVLENLGQNQPDPWESMVGLEAGLYGDEMLFDPIDWESLATTLDLPSNF